MPRAGDIYVSAIRTAIVHSSRYRRSGGERGEVSTAPCDIWIRGVSPLQIDGSRTAAANEGRHANVNMIKLRAGNVAGEFSGAQAESHARGVITAKECSIVASRA